MTDASFRPGPGDTVLVGRSCGLDEPDCLLVVTAVRDCEGRPGWVALDGIDAELGHRRTGVEVEAPKVHLWQGSMPAARTAVPTDRLP